MCIQRLNEEQLSGRGDVLVQDGSKLVGEESPVSMELNWCRVLNFANTFSELDELGEVWGVGGGGHIWKGEFVLIVIGEEGGFGGGVVVIRPAVNGKGVQ